MGEAIIARGQTARKNVLDDIPVSGDYCSIVVLLQDSAGQPCENTKINCKDGSRWYNYTTNEAGMALFKCNSGSAKITANNWINGVRTFDQNGFTKNLDSPVGTKRLEEMSFTKINHFSYFPNSGNLTYIGNGIQVINQNNPWQNGQFRTIDSVKNVILIGGGGAGSASGNRGGGGGGGAKNYAESISIAKNQIYNLYIGLGGVPVSMSGTIYTGTSGSTTSGFGLSANGGSYSYNNDGGLGGIGLYNGGNGGNGGNNKTAEGNGRDGENGAGGGGAGLRRYSSNSSIVPQNGGNNGGGSYAISEFTKWWGIDGSGGGGMAYPNTYQIGNYSGDRIYTNGYKGGSGRIEFDM